jgi:hypothetical protein
MLSTKFELQLRNWLLEMADGNRPVLKLSLVTSVHNYCDEMAKLNQPVRKPGKKWYRLWRKRNPDLSLQIAEPLSQGRADLSEEKIRTWFSEVKAYLIKKQLLSVFDNPSRIFNCDKTAVYLAPKGNHVFARRGDKNVYQSLPNSEKENVTFLVTFSADGSLAPPQIVFHYKRVPGDVSRSVPSAWGIGLSESGWRISATFFEYVANVFEPHLTRNNIPRPVILFFDGHASHMTLQLSEFCSVMEIELLVFLPKATHAIQPLDQTAFKSFKSIWKEEVDTF